MPMERRGRVIRVIPTLVNRQREEPTGCDGERQLSMDGTSRVSATSLLSIVCLNRKKSLRLDPAAMMAHRWRGTSLRAFCQTSFPALLLSLIDPRRDLRDPFLAGFSTFALHGPPSCAASVLLLCLQALVVGRWRRFCF